MRRLSSSASILASFPEWGEGLAHCSAGRHAAAIAPLQRLIEVCDSVMGADSPAAALALRRVLAARAASGASSTAPSAEALERMGTSAHASEFDVARVARCALRRGMLDVASQCGARLQRHGAARSERVGAAAAGAGCVAAVLTLRARVARAANDGAGADALGARARATLDEALGALDFGGGGAAAAEAPLLLLMGAASDNGEAAVESWARVVAILDAVPSAAPLPLPQQLQIAAWRSDALCNIGAASLASDVLPLDETGASSIERALKEARDVDEARRGRAIAMMAAMLHREEKAVSAEGLFRSGIDELRSAVEASSGGALDLTPRLALSSALRNYAALLAEWDKRDGDAAVALHDADAADALTIDALALRGDDDEHALLRVAPLGMGAEVIVWGREEEEDCADGDNAAPPAEL